MAELFISSKDAAVDLGVDLGTIKTRGPHRRPEYLEEEVVRHGLSGADLWAAVDQFESGLRSNA
jgi:hypothetical protein